MKKLSSFLLIVLSVIVLAACSQTPESQIDSYQGSPQEFKSNPEAAMPTFDQTAMPEKGEKIVVMDTEKGTIKLRLFPQFAPKAVENFTGLIAKGYYDGLIFHRVIPGFMIQGGDPTGTGRGGESLWGGVFENEAVPQLKNIRGALAMANAGPDTNGSQFYIVQKDSSWLDGGYTVFGQVIDGMDAVDAIAGVERDASDKPLKDVKIKSVSVQAYE